MTEDIDKVTVEPFFADGVADWEVRTHRTDGTSYTPANVSWRELMFRRPTDPRLSLFIHVSPGVKDPREAEAIVTAIHDALNWRQANPDVI